MSLFGIDEKDLEIPCFKGPMPSDKSCCKISKEFCKKKTSSIKEIVYIKLDISGNMNLENNENGVGEMPPEFQAVKSDLGVKKFNGPVINPINQIQKIIDVPRFIPEKFPISVFPSQMPATLIKSPTTLPQSSMKIIPPPVPEAPPKVPIDPNQLLKYSSAGSSNSEATSGNALPSKYSENPLPEPKQISHEEAVQLCIKLSKIFTYQIQLENAYQSSEANKSLNELIGPTRKQYEIILPQLKENITKMLEIIKKIKCSKCPSNDIKLKLECGHAYCKNCMLNMNYQSNPNDHGNDLPYCPECDTQLSEDEYNELHSQNEQFIVSTEAEYRKWKLMKIGFLMCIVCKKLKKKYFENSCYHMCRDCSAIKIRGIDQKCILCKFYYDESALNIEAKCGKCCKNDYFVGDYMKDLHEDKCVFCIKCLGELKYVNNCPLCNVIIRKKDSNDIEKFLEEYRLSYFNR